MIRVDLINRFLKGSFWLIPQAFFNLDELKFLKEFFYIKFDGVEGAFILRKREKFINRFN